jgi:catechol 2,3-dioxygenase-like lactoylglutathione lyase family enzyme
MIDHIGFGVSDLGRAKAFYQAALAPIGVTLIVELSREQTGGEDHAGFGAAGRPFFWIATGKPLQNGLHVAFTAPDRAAVDAFHQAALAAGGVDNGAPGVRAYYHPSYYGAFVRDADGNNVEAVCHKPEQGA